MSIKTLFSYMKYLIEECYLEDYDPYYAEFWYDNYSYQYSFKEWYFLYRKKFKKNNYKYTHPVLIIASNPNYFKEIIKHNCIKI